VVALRLELGVQHLETVTVVGLSGRACGRETFRGFREPESSARFVHPNIDIRTSEDRVPAEEVGKNQTEVLGYFRRRTGYISISEDRPAEEVGQARRG
jgi:hypothetical protein